MAPLSPRIARTAGSWHQVWKLQLLFSAFLRDKCMYRVRWSQDAHFSRSLVVNSVLWYTHALKNACAPLGQSWR